MSIARLRPGVGEQLWFSSVDGWSNLVPFPTGKFVCWRVLSSCLCQHIPALFCNTLPNTYKTGQQGFAHLLLTNPQKCLVKKMIFNKIPVGKGMWKQGLSHAVVVLLHISPSPNLGCWRRWGLPYCWPLRGYNLVYLGSGSQTRDPLMFQDPQATLCSFWTFQSSELDLQATP